MSFNYAVQQMLDNQKIRDEAGIAYLKLCNQQFPGDPPWYEDVIEAIFTAIKENLP